MSETRSVESTEKMGVPARRAERVRRIKLSIFTAVLTRPLALIAPLVTVPLFFGYLGRERYGLFETAVALGAWINLTNLGLSLGLMNKLTDCYVAEDRAMARRAVTTMIMTMLGIVGLGIVIWTGASMIIPWRQLIVTEDPKASSELPWVMWTAGLLTLAAVAVRLPTPIYSAYQELHRNNVWDGLAKLGTIAACVAVVFTGFGLVGVIVVFIGTAVFIRLINLVFLFGREKPWLRPGRGLFDRSLLRPLLVQGVGLFVLQMAVVVLFQTDKLIIVLVLGPSEVAEYAVIGKLFIIFYGVYALVLKPLWPAHGEAIRRGDLAWTRKVLHLSAVLGCGIPLACGTILFFAGDLIFDLWTRGQSLNVSRHLIVAFTVMFALRAWLESHSIVLNSVGVLKPQAIFFAVQAGLNIPLAVILAKWFGIVGVAWATSITTVLVTGWGYPWMMRRYLGRMRRTGTETTTGSSGEV